MAVKKFKPVTPGTRHKIIGTFDEITTNKPEKSLLSPQKNSGGRNNSGKMTVRYIGGGNKQMYRNIDFKRTKDGIAATVKLSSTIPIVPHVLHFWYMPTVRRATSSHRTDSKWVRPW